MKAQKQSMKTIFRSLLVAVAWVGMEAIGTICAQESSTTSAEVDKWVGEMEFQFLPNPLQSEESNASVIQGYFSKTPEFPLWLMMDMGGPLQVDETHFSVNSSTKDADGVWVVDLSCADSVNGFFKLNLAIDSKTGDAALKIATATDGDIVMYQGKIGPYAGSGIPNFRNDKKTEEVERTAVILDRILPALDFTVKLNSELYGSKAKIIVTPKNVQVLTSRKFDADEFKVICCEKKNGVWYLRLEVGEATLVSEAMYLDMVIDSWTGDVNYRMGLADQLRNNWRAIIDGVVVLP